MRNTFIAFLLILMAGCKQNGIMKQLVSIDSTASKEGDLKALSLLEEIVPITIDDEESRAYYLLLKARTEIRLQKNISSAEQLDISILFYKRTKDYGKLIRAYIYKAYIMDKTGDIRGALRCLKEAEFLLENYPEEIILANNIYTQLAYINSKSKEPQLALRYGKKALKTAYQLGSKYDITYALMNMHLYCKHVGQVDSAIFYYKKCENLIEESIPLSERRPFYNNMGLTLLENDVEAAEKYLQKAFAISPNAYTYNGLANIYFKRGEMVKAQELWQKALQTDNLYLKAEILQAQSECQQAMGDYQSACATILRMAEVKDSILQKQHEEDIRGMQQRFDQERAALREHNWLMMAIWTVCALLFLAVASCLYLYRRYLVGNRQLRAISRQLDRYRSRLKVLQDEGKTDTREVERLTQKIAELQKRQNAQLENGRRLMEEIEAGGNTVRWHRNDFADCIEYYRTVDPSFVAHMETDFDHLSAKYIFFSIIENQGYDMEQLQRIMAVSQSTVRSIRSRINNSLIHENNR